MLDAGDTDLEVYKDETGEYRYVKTGEKVPVRYAPSVGLNAVQQRKQGGGTGMESDVSKYVKNLAEANKGQTGQGPYADSLGLGTYTNASGTTTTLGTSPSLSGSTDVGFDLGSSLGRVGQNGALNANTATTVDAGSVGTFDTAGLADSGGGSSMGGGWGSAFTGAIAGVTAATNRREKYKAEGREDPVMERAKADGFGQEHEDWRDIAGGGTLGAVLGYFGGPVGSAVAGPVVDAVHPYGEKLTRTMVNLGDDLGGVGGAMMTDPIGAIASGKYSYEDTFWGGLLGPAYDLFD